MKSYATRYLPSIECVLQDILRIAVIHPQRSILQLGLKPDVRRTNRPNTLSRSFRVAQFTRNGHPLIMPQASLDTQFGPLCVTEQDGAIVALDWGHAPQQDQTPLLTRALDQLAAYDAGTLEMFDLPLHVAGTDFQRAVCDAMSAIPMGETRTYGDIARDLGAMPQAVGQACGANPIPVIIPCHRVMGAKGLTGFSGAGGVETKVALLRHEKAGGFLI